MDFRFAGKAEQGKDGGVADFDKCAGGVADDPLTGGDLVGLPALAGFDDKLGVIF